MHWMRPLLLSALALVACGGDGPGNSGGSGAGGAGATGGGGTAGAGTGGAGAGGAGAGGAGTGGASALVDCDGGCAALEAAYLRCTMSPLESECRAQCRREL